MLRAQHTFEPLFVRALAVSAALHMALFAWIAFGGRLHVGSSDVRVIPVTLVAGPVGPPPRGEAKPRAAVSADSERTAKPKKEESSRMKAPNKSKPRRRPNPKDEEKRIRSLIEKIKKEAQREQAADSGAGGTSGVVGPYGSGGLMGTIASFYLQEIWDAIRRNWSLPKAGVDIPKDAFVSFLVKIDSAGRLMSVSVIKPSGYDLLDSSALAAIKKAAPFSPPPSVLVDTLSKEGIEVRFFAKEAGR